MPAVTFNLYDNFRKKQAGGNGAVKIVGVGNLTVKAMVVTGGYTPNQNTHDFRDDLGANEVIGTNYPPGGQTLANPVEALDGVGNYSLDFDDPAAIGVSGTGFSNGRRIVIYVSRGGAASADELIGFSNDFGSDQGNVNGDFQQQLNAAGLFTSPR